MINDYLFGILKRADPSAEVVSECEPASYSQAPARAGYNGRKAFPTVEHWGESYRMNCPFCGDKRRRLFFCHLAGAKVRVPNRKGLVNFSPFVCVCHNEHCNHEAPEFAKWIRDLKLTDGPPIDLSTGFSPRKVDGYSFLFASEEDTLPEPCYPLTSSEVPAHVLDYLDSRAFDPYTLQAEYGAGYSPNGAVYRKMSDAEVEELKSHGQEVKWEQQFGRLWGERIVVPVIQGRRLVGWQGRTPYDPPSGREPKYFFGPRLDKSRSLFNLDRALLGNTVVIVEGVFDAFRVGCPALALFGKTVSQAQMAIMNVAFSQNAGALVMLDPEASEETFKLAETLHSQKIFPRGVVPVYLPNPGPDPAECSASYLKSLLDTHGTQLLTTLAGDRPQMSSEELLQGFEVLEDPEDDE